MPVLNHWILGFYYKIIERDCKKRCRKNEYENDFYTLINHIDTQCLLGTNSKIVNEVKIGSSSLQFFSKKIELNTTTHLVCVI